MVSKLEHNTSYAYSQNEIFLTLLERKKVSKSAFVARHVKTEVRLVGAYIHPKQLIICL